MSFAYPRRIALPAIGALVLLAILLVIAFPMGWLKGAVERRLSTQFGSAATIGSLDRENRFSLSPVIRIADVRVAQPAWAGRSDMASIGLVRMRIHLMPLLLGRFDSDLLTARGVRLALIRDANGRENWRKDSERNTASGGSGMAGVSIEDATLHYDDAKQNRSITVGIRIDPRAGLSIAGTGMIDGAPVTLQARGGPMAPDRPWPFAGRIDGTAITMRAAGTMARPLATGDMRFHLAARADDLKRIDHVIEAGLFGTQPVTLAADVVRKADIWTIAPLTGTIGASAMAGHLTVAKADGRTKLDGAVRFARLNFDDLSSNAGQAKAALLERQQGPKLVPNTRINIRKIRRTDGHITIAADRIVGGKRPSSITSLSGQLDLDNRILTVSHLRLGLAQGAIVGQATVDQRDDQPKPRMALQLALQRSSIAALAGAKAGPVEARVDGRVTVVGVGDTIREAVGQGNGTIGLAARSGALPDKFAALLGFDLGRGLIASKDRSAGLRCAVLRLDLHHGVGTADPLLIDTSISQSRGTGAIRFPAEALDLALTGAPKQKALLQLQGAVRLSGTIRAPNIIVPPSVKKPATILKALGRSLSGENPVVAADADCAGLVARAIGAGR